MERQNLASLSYGISKPSDLFEKLKVEGQRLAADRHPYDVFNFIITGAVLTEWVCRVHKETAAVRKLSQALKQKSWALLPVETIDWVSERSSVLMTGPDVRYHVLSVLQLIWQTANATKHFHWTNTSDVTDIQPEPIVGNWYQYFTTSREPDLYIEYESGAYGLREIRSVLEQFFEGLLRHIASAPE